MVIQEDNLLDLKEGLNNGQSEGFDKLVDFLTGSHGGQMFVLKGYAGTGKTFLSMRIVNYILKYKRGRTVGISAPTNKALKVLNEGIDSNLTNVNSKTVYQFLGLTEKVDKYGNRTFERDKKTKQIPMDYVSYIIVDETSMLNDEIFEKLYPYRFNVKIIFMGDPAQIPPIGKVSCIPFDHAKSHMFIIHELREIMRQKAGNPIIELSQHVRMNLDSKSNFVTTSNVNQNSMGIIALDGKNQSERDMLKPMLNQYFNSEDFRRNSNYAKVIAWRRETVSYLNNIIREMIFPADDYDFDLMEHSLILPGEKLIANSPIFSGNSISFNTSDEFEVISVTEGLEFLKGKNLKMVAIKIYNCMVEGNLPTGTFRRQISVLHEDSKQDYRECIDALKHKAITHAKSNVYWLDYYNAQKKFADVAYNYAITAHKAQGSTYKNVFFIESDVNVNSNVVERNQIKYTSYTRPTDRLIIFT